MMNAVVLLCLSGISSSEPVQAKEPTLRQLHAFVTVPGPSKARFEIFVNGQRKGTFTDSRKLDLTQELRPGRNYVNVRFEAWNGKISLFHPSTLKLTDGSAKEARELLSIRANTDNPRGSHRIWFHFEPSTRR